MPYGDPTLSGSEYRANLVSKASAGGYPVYIECTLTADNPVLPAVADIFQQFVDLISSSTDFTVNATRTQEYAETVTETA